ncbi:MULTISPECIES: phosphate ABC transporter substrate-binding protein PstS [Microbacterium]|uniref:Phosphate-binding protein n=1 Tax=Microbacterium wangchenii TaxID=2541726 RepID=A0ABX5SXM4_9MICO|nr:MULTISPECIES: phosphate ABC transporter substrate-binding protein PstS [Microbacterium]MCK6067500.1 phosphate ABC transporter substrate-binding protein PstS [Microbacterium sp. EYE_512]QBR89570.1 phosphate ABC transporter substrate-binding protein PstS [Microbacterium wangchenii]TXK16832.1 phosphate ABC transporter substrate-binding protein PstS [Microbacterium wangchenii]
MKITRFARLGAVAAAAALALTGCAVNEQPGGAAPAAGDGLSGTLVGGGASSQEVAVQTWTAGLQGANPDLTIDYDPAGSGTGRESFQAGAFQFAGSDRPFTVEEIEAGPFDACVEGSDIVELPTYISPIAVVFNLEGIDTLNLDATTLAGMFAGTITTWNDPAIAALNDGVTLPATDITPVHRSDDSGTTENFTDYLFQAAPDVWTSEPDGVWPLRGGEAAQGTSGVISAVEGGQGTIGYADASRAGDLGTVAIKVGEEFVPYSPEAAAAVVDASPEEEGRADTDIAIALDRTTTAAGVYPIVLVSYMVGCADYQDDATAALVKALFEYVASPEGQDAAAEAAGSAPISDALREQVSTAIDAIQ